MIYDFIIIGGGASGMMASISLKEMGKTVCILEKNEKLGKKLFITGKGRCNLTNFSDVKSHIENIVTNSKFMLSSLSRFTPNQTIEFFNSIGLKTKIERGNRVFPTSDKSSDVIKVLSNKINSLNVDVKLNTEVISVKKDNNIFNILCKNDIKYTSYNVVVATGGVSYPLTGSTGFGYEIAKSFGINVTNLKPALVPIILKDDVKSLQGIVLKNVKVYCEKYNSEIGEILFTDKGVSGPLILSISSRLNKLENLQGKILSIDLKPGLSIQMLENKFERELKSDEFKNKYISNYLKTLMPSNFVKFFMKKLELNDTTSKFLNKSDIEKIFKGLKSLNLVIDKLDNISNGIITSGGVDCKEISPKNMESKKVDGLYFIGEVIDVDALTGGFNLQIAWSTAKSIS